MDGRAIPAGGVPAGGNVSSRNPAEDVPPAHDLSGPGDLGRDPPDVLLSSRGSCENGWSLGADRCLARERRDHRLVWDLTIAAIALTVFIIAEVAVRRNWIALIAIPATFCIGVSAAACRSISSCARRRA
jgi:hypothetical protein